MSYAIVETRGHWLAVEFDTAEDAQKWVNDHGIGRMTGQALRRSGQRVGNSISGDLFVVERVVTPETAEQLQAGGRE